MGLLGGALITTSIFFLTAHNTKETDLINEIKKDTTYAVTPFTKSAESIDFDYFSSMKLTLTGDDTIVVQGKFQPKIPVDEVYAQNKGDKFVAIYQEGPKGLIDQLAGREAPKKLSQFLIFHGLDEDTLRLRNMHQKDVFQTGMKAILFELSSRYANGESITPVILYKNEGKWNLLMLENFNKQALKALKDFVIGKPKAQKELKGSLLRCPRLT